VRQDFVDGAYFVYGHTVLQRRAGLGYQSDWAASYLPTRRDRNQFYTRLGRAVPPGAAGARLLDGVGAAMTPADLLAHVQRS
jgi:hypothetical protein